MPEHTTNAKESTDTKTRRRVSEPEVLSESPPLATSLADAGLDIGRARPATILHLQRVVGNQAVSRLIQAKLTVGPADDRYEQEADRVADQVITMPARVRQPENGGQAQRQIEEEEVQAKPLAISITPLVQRYRLPAQRQFEEEELQTKPLLQRQVEEEELQMKPDLQRQVEEEEIQTSIDPWGSFDLASDLEHRLDSQRGAGSPLPSEVRSFMEPRFGADFGQVRVHTGSEASGLNRSLSAQAFTHGQDIYMGAGRYNPASTAGKQLLAHELTHVIQQTGSTRVQPASSKVVQGSWAGDFEEFFKKEKWVGGFKSAQTDAGKLPKEAGKSLLQSLKPETENWQWLQNLKQQFANWKAKTKGTTGLKTFSKRLRSVGEQVGEALGSAFLGPIWKVGKAIKNWDSGKSEENFKDWRHYIDQIKQAKARVPVTAEPKWMHYIPPVLSLVASVAGDLAGFVGWAALIIGLIGLIPYCQPALGVSGILGLVALGLTGLRLLVNGTLDGWRNFRLSYLYSLIKDNANPTTGVLNAFGQRLAKTYQETRGEYEITKGQYSGDLVSTVVGAVTAGVGSGVGSAVGGKGFGSGFAEGMNPLSALKVEPVDLGKVASSLTGAGTAPVVGSLGEETGTLTGRQVKKEGTAPDVTHPKVALQPTVANINDLLKPPLSTTSGKLRSVLNPVTAIWTMLKGAATILRSVVNGFAWFIGLVARFKKWAEPKFTGSKWDPRTWKRRWQGSKAQKGLESFGQKVKGVLSKIHRKVIQPKREPGVMPRLDAHERQATGVLQRQEDEDLSGSESTETDETEETAPEQMDDETQSKLADFTGDNKAERMAKALEDFADVFGEAKASVEEAAEGGAG